MPMENAAPRTSPRSSAPAVCLLTLLLTLGLSACVTQPGGADVFPDHLERLPAGARVQVNTRDGRQLKLRVTEATPTGIRGVDRRYRSYALARDDIDSLEVMRQNDWVVALAFFGVVFVTGF